MRIDPDHLYELLEKMLVAHAPPGAETEMDALVHEMAAPLGDAVWRLGMIRVASNEFLKHRICASISQMNSKMNMAYIGNSLPRTYGYTRAKLRSYAMKGDSFTSPWAQLVG